ncbi:sugar transferase [Roseivirga sp.]|uniref:sugar transferase n=1 Tax=Roseivirga sp. TaxID=1964215 RepID=UPI003B8D19FC
MTSSKTTQIAKRTLDIIVSALMIMMLSPLLLIIILAIRLESKGPVFYYAMRVGQNYHTFKFYKFRSMRTDADQMVENMKHLNQYDDGKNDECEQHQLNRHLISNIDKHRVVVGDDVYSQLDEFEDHKATDERNTFVKFKNDPRITRVGKFIRNTSIDELPQLFNILIGDMSLVGNRPLPLYEAEKLTKDHSVGRFLAPAGLTGLWQVTERGKDNADPERRIELDIEYALHHSFWMDMKILFKTPVAAFQHENV